jgi:hypothetical protein
VSARPPREGTPEWHAWLHSPEQQARIDQFWQDWRDQHGSGTTEPAVKVIETFFTRKGGRK